MKRATLFLILFFTAFALTGGEINTAKSDLALKGYDAVAYFESGKPVLGSKAFEHRWSGAVWRFASAANRDRLVSSQ